MFKQTYQKDEIILGLDPGTATVGFAFSSGTRKNPIISEYGILRTKALPPDMMPQRLLEIAQDLERLLDIHKPTKAIVEELYFFKNHKTVISVAQSRGILLYLLAKRGIEIISATPLQIKQTLCGYGRADKRQVQIMVQKVYGLNTLPVPDDAADSLAMAWWGLK
ncbi:MAG: crossover junction endodeoxyribonuclease RuvC [Patescibacteria group bacterium]